MSRNWIISHTLCLSISPSGTPNTRLSQADQVSKSMVRSETCKIRKWPGTKTLPFTGKMEWPRSCRKVRFPELWCPRSATSLPCWTQSVVLVNTGSEDVKWKAASLTKICILSTAYLGALLPTSQSVAELRRAMDPSSADSLPRASLTSLQMPRSVPRLKRKVRSFTGSMDFTSARHSACSRESAALRSRRACAVARKAPRVTAGLPGSASPRSAGAC
mmetsp:Transcript_114831/g.357681  ORF Transcript_114831/g.357681 Transcript_114831/m.357681 type:complete len:218 (-) Transcript_114831:67-720(-)